MMMFHRKWFLIGFCLLTMASCNLKKPDSAVQQRPEPDSSLFPTTAGAYWIYRYQFSPGATDTTVVCRITGKRFVGNRVFHEFINYPGPSMPGALNRQSSRLLRYDVVQQAVVEWIESIQRETVIFMVTDPLVSRRSEYTVSIGTLTNVFLQEADPLLRDAGITQAYAEKVGLVKFSFMTIVGGGSFELTKYRIPSP